MEAVGQLTGGIAHDFNNMLAVVVGGIDLALRRLNGPRREVSLHLNNAMEGATRAAALTRRLLSFARSEPLLPERVDSRDLIDGMSDLLDRTLGERITRRHRSASPKPGRPMSTRTSSKTPSSTSPSMPATRWTAQGTLTHRQPTM